MSLAQDDCGIPRLLQYIATEAPEVYRAFHRSVEVEPYPRDKITLPVVVHVVYREERENISDLQIRSQIDALNRGFNGLIPLSTDLTDSIRNVIQAADIHFQLACRDPEGGQTNGINRRHTTIENIGYALDQGKYAVHHSLLGGVDPWPQDEYINIWVCAMPTNYLGRATMPIPLADPNEDGLVINYQHFGYIGTAAQEQPYDLGRTLIHEMGHYLGLNHPWGSIAENCLDDDGVDDTPPQSTIYFGCPSPMYATSCSTWDAAHNFMQYEDDQCLQYFTKGQVDRMHSYLRQYRNHLLTSTGLQACQPSGGSIADDIRYWYDTDHRRLVMSLPPHLLEVRLELWDAGGRLVKAGQIAQTDFHSFDLWDVSSGIYIIRLIHEDEQWTNRVIIY